MKLRLIKREDGTYEPTYAEVGCDYVYVPKYLADLVEAYVDWELEREAHDPAVAMRRWNHA